MKYVQFNREKEKRVTEPIVITTENVVELEDGSFENWHKKEVYKKTIWSVGTTGLGIDSGGLIMRDVLRGGQPEMR